MATKDKPSSTADVAVLERSNVRIADLEAQLSATERDGREKLRLAAEQTDAVRASLLEEIRAHERTREELEQERPKPFSASIVRRLQAERDILDAQVRSCVGCRAAIEQHVEGSTPPAAAEIVSEQLDHQAEEMTADEPVS